MSLSKDDMRWLAETRELAQQFNTAAVGHEASIAVAAASIIIAHAISKSPLADFEEHIDIVRRAIEQEMRVIEALKAHRKRH